MIREGMVVRTPDGEKVGRVASVGTDDFTVEHGYIFKHSFIAPLAHVIAVDDEKDELICRPLELPWADREIPEMMFGGPETVDELDNRRDAAALGDALLVDPHLHKA